MAKTRKNRRKGLNQKKGKRSKTYRRSIKKVGGVNEVCIIFKNEEDKNMNDIIIMQRLYDVDPTDYVYLLNVEDTDVPDVKKLKYNLFNIIKKYYNLDDGINRDNIFVNEFDNRERFVCGQTNYRHDIFYVDFYLNHLKYRWYLKKNPDFSFSLLDNKYYSELIEADRVKDRHPFEAIKITRDIKENSGIDLETKFYLYKHVDIPEKAKTNWRNMLFGSKSNPKIYQDPNTTEYGDSYNPTQKILDDVSQRFEPAEIIPTSEPLPSPPPPYSRPALRHYPGLKGVLSSNEEDPVIIDTPDIPFQKTNPVKARHVLPERPQILNRTDSNSSLLLNKYMHDREYDMNSRDKWLYY